MFDRNVANIGGALYAWSEVIVDSTGSRFLDNIAWQNGGELAFDCSRNLMTCFVQARFTPSSRPSSSNRTISFVSSEQCDRRRLLCNMDQTIKRARASRRNSAVAALCL